MQGTALRPNEAVQSALHQVNKEISSGLETPVAIRVVAGRIGIPVEQLEYFYELHN